MKIFGQWSELTKLIFKEDGQDVTLDANQSTTYTASRQVELPPGDTAHVLVSATSTQTLTNKSIDADTNTITNIDNNEIKAAAAIDATKIADGSVSNTEFQYLDGVSSAIQTQINGKEPAFTTLSVAKGGTNSGTALNNNRVIKSAGGAIVEAAAITANRALASDSNGIPVHTAVTDTELGYVSGVTSAIQTQFTGKQANVITTQGDLVIGNASNVAARLAIGGSGTVLTSDGTTASWSAASGGESVNTVSSAGYTILTSDGYTTIYITAGGTNRTVTLPALSSSANRLIRIIKADGVTSAGAGKVTVTRAGSDVIGPSSETSIDLYTADDHIVLQGGSSVWMILDILQTEYIYNSSTTTNGGDTTSFAYGTGGAQIQNITVNLARRVRAQSALRATDTLFFQISTDQTLWHQLNGFFFDSGSGLYVCPWITQGTRFYGAGKIQRVTASTTDLDIGFGTFCYPSGSAYNTDGAAWATGTGDLYWRVAKIRRS